MGPAGLSARGSSRLVVVISATKAPITTTNRLELYEPWARVLITTARRLEGVVGDYIGNASYTRTPVLMGHPARRAWAASRSAALTIE